MTKKQDLRYGENKAIRKAAFYVRNANQEAFCLPQRANWQG